MCAGLHEPQWNALGLSTPITHLPLLLRVQFAQRLSFHYRRDQAPLENAGRPVIC